MIIHLFPWSPAFTENWIKYVKENFNNENHQIFVYGNLNSEYINELSKYKYVYVLILPYNKSKFLVKNNKSYKLLKEYIKKSNSIILHYADLFWLKKLLLHPNYMKKTRIVCWGGDIEILKNTKKGNFLKWIYRKKIMQIVFSCVNTVGFLIKEDFEWVKKIIPFIKKSMIVQYKFIRCSERDKYYLYDKSKDYYWIQLGNSATETNNHINIIKKLTKYRGQAFKLYVPLSYGNQEYAKKVIEAGKKYLGEQFVPITDYMTYEQYCTFLNNMSIAIYNYNRQQGLGNIEISIQYGSKIYMNTESPTYKFLTRQGYIIYDKEDIGCVPFEQFIDIDSGIMDKNREKKLMEDYQYQHNVDTWKKFFY